MNFTSNSDYPLEEHGERRHGACGQAQFLQCDRYNTNVCFEGGPILADMLVPRPRPKQGSTQAQRNTSDDGDDDDTDSSDSDSDEDTPRVESSYAIWIQRRLKPAIYGSVELGAIVKRLDQPMINAMGETVVWEATNKRCAIKIYSRRHILEQRGSAENPMNEIAATQFLAEYQRRRFQQESMEEDGQGSGEQIVASALNNSFAANVMLPLGVYYNESDIFNIMPFCDGGELFDVLDSRQKFPEPEARYWMHQILNGVETLQQAGICHRDMSLENLLTDRSGQVLIIDLGMCIKIPYVDDIVKNPGTKEETVQDPNRFGDHRERRRCLIRRDRACGKPYYMSPEIRRNRSSFDGHAIDMWALGPVLFLMVAGFPPWEIADNSDERFYYFSNGYFAQTVASWNLGLSADLIDLLQRMFFINPTDRLSLDQVRAHPWMQGLTQPPPI